MPLLISINWSSLVTSWVVVQKIYSKMYLFSYANTHHDVTDSVNHGMIKNTNTWISWERNIIFLQNKRILNLWLRWCILRSYHFVAELTFNKVATCNCSCRPVWCCEPPSRQVFPLWGDRGWQNSLLPVPPSVKKWPMPPSKFSLSPIFPLPIKVLVPPNVTESG